MRTERSLLQRFAQSRPLTWLLAGFCGWALLLWLGALLGMGGRVAPVRGASVEACQFLTAMPVTRIDAAMVAAAIEQGPRVAVLATVETTLKPTLEFIGRRAREAGKQLDIRPNLMAEAFTALLAGDMATHDRIVSAGLRAALESADVVVLAQASMARVMESMEKPSVPVLTSPESGVMRLKEMIAALA